MNVDLPRLIPNSCHLIVKLCNDLLIAKPVQNVNECEIHGCHASGIALRSLITLY
jgi:hypothetical protein